MADGTLKRARGGLRILAFLLTWWEPLGFAVAAAGAINAVQVRGVPVALVLVARLLTTVLSVAAGRALVDTRWSSRTLALAALPASAAVQLFAALTPYFPSNRMPGDTPLYVAAILTYYGGWTAYLLYLATSD
jgi:hypothetical protein